MALIYIDSFDTYSDPADLPIGRWTSIDEPARLRILTGGQANSSGRYLQVQETASVRRFFGDYTTFVVGFAFRMPAPGPVENLETISFFRFRKSSQTELNLVYNVASGSVDLYRGYFGNGSSALLAAGTTSLGLGVWNYIEFKATMSDTANGSYELRLNGFEEYSASNVRTSFTNGITEIEEIWLDCDNASSILGHNDPEFDDFYFLDTTGTRNNDFLGPIRIDAIVPTSDVTSDLDPSSGSTNFDKVDDIPHDGDTTYVQSNVAGERDVYEMSAIALAGTRDVFGVQHVTVARKDDSNTRALTPVLISNGNEVNGSSQVLTTNYRHYVEMYNEDPDGNVDWTDTAVDSLQAGTEIV